MGIKCLSSNKQKDSSQQEIIKAQKKEETKIKEEEDKKDEKTSKSNEENTRKKEKSPESHLSTKQSQKELMPKTTTLSSLKASSTGKSKNVVAIDSNVFVVKGETSPDLFYIREKTLGHGSYGTVYLVKHKQLHRYFAMKVIKKSHKNKSEEESLMNEINILRKIDHQNNLKMNDFYNQKKNMILLLNIVKKENYLMK